VAGAEVAPVLSPLPAAPPPPPLTAAAARIVAHRPEWEAEKARREREVSEQAKDGDVGGDGSRARS